MSRKTWADQTIELACEKASGEAVSSNSLLCALNTLVENWTSEHDFLNGPDDIIGDKLAGQAYGECAKQLSETLKAHNILLSAKFG